MCCGRPVDHSKPMRGGGTPTGLAGRPCLRSLPNSEIRTSGMPNRASRLGPRAHLRMVAFTAEHAAPALGQALPLEPLELELQLQDAHTICCACSGSGRGGS